MAGPRHGTYQGARQLLRGKAALLRPHPTLPGKVLAQFDDLSLGRQYTHSWTAHDGDDFEWDGDNFGEGEQGS